MLQQQEEEQVPQHHQPYLPLSSVLRNIGSMLQTSEFHHPGLPRPEMGLISLKRPIEYGGDNECALKKMKQEQHQQYDHQPLYEQQQQEQQQLYQQQQQEEQQLYQQQQQPPPLPQVDDPEAPSILHLLGGEDAGNYEQSEEPEIGWSQGSWQ
jgi:hypothetical protein